MKDLVERVRRECVGVYFEQNERSKPGFGEEEEVQSRLLVMAEPHLHYSKWNLFLPKQFRLLVSRKSDEYFNLHGLDVFHYELTSRGLFEGAKEIAETARWINDRLSKTNSKANKHPEFKPEDFINYLSGKYGEMSCIRTNIWTYTLLMGNRRTMQEVMDFFKASPQNTFNFMRILMGDTASTVDEAAEIKKTANLYDLLSKPREIHFDL